MFSLKKINSKLGIGRNCEDKKLSSSRTKTPVRFKRVSGKTRKIKSFLPLNSGIDKRRSDADDQVGKEEEGSRKKLGQRYFSNLKSFAQNHTSVDKIDTSTISVLPAFATSARNTTELNKSFMDIWKRGRFIKKEMKRKSAKKVRRKQVLDKTVSISGSLNKSRDQSTETSSTVTNCAKILKSTHSVSSRPRLKVLKSEQKRVKAKAKKLAGGKENQKIAKSSKLKNRKVTKYNVKSRSDKVAKFINDNNSGVLLPEKTKFDEAVSERDLTMNHDEASSIVQSIVASTSHIDILELEEKKILVALIPGTSIVFNGVFWLRPILGSVEVLGYKLIKNERRAVFSLPNHLPITLQAGEGEDVSTFVLDFAERSSEWLARIKDTTQSVVIIELEWCDTALTSFLNETKIICRSKSRIFEEFQKSNLLSLEAGVCIHPSWKSFLEQSFNSSRIVITGGKSVGKSTFLKYLVNSLLSSGDFSEVAVLDLDPGQPEFSLPGSLSLVKLSNPLLGPAFTHGENVDFTYKRNILFGNITVQGMVQEYFEIFLRLLNEFNDLSDNMVPLLVNTMGYTKDVGLDIMVDILKLVKPTHVVTIESLNPKFNFSFRLYSDAVGSCNRGLVMRGKGITLDYQLFLFPVASGVNRYNNAAKARSSSRDLLVLSYLSSIWRGTFDRFFPLSNCKTPIVIKYKDIGIYIVDAFVPISHVLMAINGNLVALCTVDEDFVLTVGPGLPKQVCQAQWTATNVCVGWAVVRGIDPLKGEIHLLTPLSEKTVKTANVLVLTRSTLPPMFREFFSDKIGVDVPYTSKQNRKKHFGLAEECVT